MLFDTNILLGRHFLIWLRSSTYIHGRYFRAEKWVIKKSELPIYRGRLYRGIRYIVVICWTPFFGAQERDDYRKIAVTPWTQIVGVNFSR